MGSQGNQDNSNHLLVPQAKDAMNRMRNEIAKDLALNVPNNDDWGNVPSRDCGRVGGQIGGKMVREMIRIAEQQMQSK